MFRDRMHWLLVLLVALSLWGGWNWWNHERRVSHPPGIVVEAGPAIHAGETRAPWEDDKGFRYASLGAFEGRAMVLARRNYDLGEFAALAPTDLALGWGELSDPRIVDQLAFPQMKSFSSRFVVPEFRRGSELRERPRPELEELFRSLTHVHTIPGAPGRPQDARGHPAGAGDPLQGDARAGGRAVRRPLRELARARRSQLRDRLDRRAGARMTARARHAEARARASLAGRRARGVSGVRRSRTLSLDGRRAARERGRRCAKTFERLAAGCPRPDERWLNWLARRRDGEALVGWHQATVTGTRADVAWVTFATHRRCGYAREGAAAVIAWLAGFGVREIVAQSDVRNDASCATASSLGFVPDAGTIPETLHGEATVDRVWRLRV